MSSDWLLWVQENLGRSEERSTEAAKAAVEAQETGATFTEAAARARAVYYPSAPSRSLLHRRGVFEAWSASAISLLSFCFMAFTPIDSATEVLWASAPFAMAAVLMALAAVGLSRWRRVSVAALSGLGALLTLFAFLFTPAIALLVLLIGIPVAVVLLFLEGRVVLLALSEESILPAGVPTPGSS
jgi:hypothetical protein